MYLAITDNLLNQQQKEIYEIQLSNRISEEAPFSSSVLGKNINKLFDPPNFSLLV